MTNRLIFIGGPPGVGKSSVTKILLSRLDNSIWLDGDDVWRMNPFNVNEKTKQMVTNNIQYVLNSFISAQFSYVIFTWVLHLNLIAESIIDKIDMDNYAFLHFTLTCDNSILKERIMSEEGRTTDVKLAFDRLEKAKSVKSKIIDTTNLTVTEVANILAKKII